MLDELGTTSDQIANALRALQIRGVRNAVRTLNPIVRYVLTVTKEANRADLILGSQLRTVFASGVVTQFPVPEPVLRFLEAFHRGEYPDLEMPTGPGSHTGG